MSAVANIRGFCAEHGDDFVPTRQSRTSRAPAAEDVRGASVDRYGGAVSGGERGPGVATVSVVGGNARLDAGEQTAGGRGGCILEPVVADQCLPAE